MTTGKHVLLTLNPDLHAALQKRAKANMMNTQELITDTLRKSIIPSPQAGKAGRPKAGMSYDPLMDYFSKPKKKK